MTYPAMNLVYKALASQKQEYENISIENGSAYIMKLTKPTADTKLISTQKRDINCLYYACIYSQHRSHHIIGIFEGKGLTQMKDPNFVSLLE